MPELLMVADDLTGANDVGVHFGARGICACVTVGAPPAAGQAVDFPVLVVDTQSRHLPAAEAAARVEAVARWGRAAGIRRFFKKTDSTLRGNLGAELDALRIAAGCALLAFVPALPAQGRTTRGGMQYVDGVPLHLSDFARDPLQPAVQSSVPALIRQQTDVPVVALGAAVLRGSGEPTLPDHGILVFDAETDREVGEVLRWLQRHDLLGALAGTSALARQMAELLPWRRPPRPPTPPRPSAGPMLVVGGSLNPRALAQLDHAAERGFATVSIPPSVLAGADPAMGARLAAEAARLLGSGRDVLLRSATTRADVDACVALGARLGLDAPALHLRVARSTGALVARVLERAAVGTLAVLGGDTLAGVVAALGGPALAPRREILPGSVLVELVDRPGPLLVSKPGGFGGDAVLSELRDLLARDRAGVMADGTSHQEEEG